MTTKYRGKYPNRIQSVWSQRSNPGVLFVKTNGGEVFALSVRKRGGAMARPMLGAEVSTLEADYVLTPMQGVETLPAANKESI